MKYLISVILLSVTLFSCTSQNADNETKLIEQYKNSQQALHKSEGISLQRKYVKVDGPVNNIHYLEAGEGTPLVLIHGAMSSTDVWTTNFINFLKKDFHLYIIDLPGFWLTDKVNYRKVSSTYRQHVVKVMDSFMNAVHLDKASLIGNSLGGLWASIYALERPKRVEKVGYIGKPLGIDNHFPFIMKLFGVRGINNLLFTPSDIDKTKEIYSSILVADVSNLSQEYIQSVSYASMLPDANFSQRTVFEKILTLSGLRDDLLVGEEMKSIKHPAIFIWGEKDVHGELSVANEIASHMSQGKVTVLKGAGHLPWLDAPKESADTIIDFFK